MAEPRRNKVSVTEMEAAPGPALQRARRGETVEVTSRGQTVAVVGPPELAERPSSGIIRRKPGTKPRGFTDEEAIDIDGSLDDLIRDGRR